MAAVHEFDGGLLLCASSSVFLAKNSHDKLSVTGSFNSKGVLRSILSTNGLVRGYVEQLSNPTTVDADVQILCSTVSNCRSLLAVGTSEKVVIILEARTLTMRRSFRVPKAPTSITFDKDDSHIVVGDRAGHVRRYTVEPSEKCGYTDMNGEECTFEGEPLSGAVTMILDVAISRDGNFLLAADRDEKIRAYVVQSYCLGHTAYVSSMALLGNRLFSSGGDSIVIEWDMESGKGVSRSGKLGEPPVRRIIVIEKVVFSFVFHFPLGVLTAILFAQERQDRTFFVIAAVGPTLHVLDERLQSVTSIEISQTIMDIAFVDGSLIGVSSDFSAGVTRFGLFDGTSSAIEIPNEVCQALLLSKDPISNYFKNVVHQNTLDYYKRKAEKLGGIEVNLRRKRKVVNLLGEVEDEKRFT
ncbi:unnamed protein product [Angiostrongylus costaricensis]|uniref:WD_REPEATS_REGION domain-containing protein n=1 Tax=Angiostrongylus costaricensis TaxID=334426 RepID=A0A0R3PQA2_ANGCS|nr:unnamed protein product [Angiostrongylus costaricensis]